MKKYFLIAVLATLPLSVSLSRADDTYQSDKSKSPAANMTEKGKPMPMAKMQENMLRMHEQIHKIMDAKSPQERERLMQEHSKMMQDDMHMMQGMMGGRRMMGGDAKGGKMDGGMKGM
ncbi:MAG: hypothetical protein NUV55_04335 [Sulfuricaulis sp.]|uniref:hypothetical protein n=1 Tax=Sulfuricaulis sp. TaxID=2003553 RepID=UPI002600014F|nr:hypothetical protein [Sulfuricaulis sp.]MCR4346426.1 hypothetical protein [Sulfuricaulis sp.]